MKTIKVGLDMDGVLVDKPPFVPKSLLEWLVRAHQKKGLAYRFPASAIEKRIRIFSHHPLFRPPIKGNLEFIKDIVKENKYQIYLITSRYSFLKNRTRQWLKFNKVDQLFTGIHLNLKNQQPHLFKAKKIKELKINFFIDDDLPLAEYLTKNFPEVKIFCFSKRNIKPQPPLFFINSFKQVFPK